MPEVPFGEVSETENFSPIPEGKYICKIADVKKEITKNNNEVWKLTLEVVEGEYKGRKIFDNLVFTEKAYSRIKKLYSAIGGYDLAQARDCETSDILDQVVLVDTCIENYQDNNGNAKSINKVTFAGYESATDPSDLVGEDENPF